MLTPTEGAKLIRATHRAEYERGWVRGMCLGMILATLGSIVAILSMGCNFDASGEGWPEDEVRETHRAQAEAWEDDESGSSSGGSEGVSGSGTSGSGSSDGESDAAAESSGGEESTGEPSFDYGICGVDCDIPCVVAVEDEAYKACAPYCEDGCGEGMCFTELDPNYVPVCFLPCPCPGGMVCREVSYGAMGCVWEPW